MEGSSEPQALKRALLLTGSGTAGTGWKNPRWRRNATAGAEAPNGFLGVYAALKRRSSTVILTFVSFPQLSRVFRALFVAEGFDGIEAGGAERGYHAADQAYGNEDNSSYEKSAGSDDEADVSSFRVFRERAV